MTGMTKRLRFCWKDVMSFGWGPVEIACSDDNVKHHYHKMKPSWLQKIQNDWLVERSKDLHELLDHNDQKGFYEALRHLSYSSHKVRRSWSVKMQNGSSVSMKENIVDCWKQYFQQHLNRESSMRWSELLSMCLRSGEMKFLFQFI